MKTYLSAIAMMAVAGSANAAVLDFENYVAGDVITSFSAGGATGNIQVIANGAPVNEAMVFDSRAFTGGDDDLQAPFYDQFEADGTPSAGANELNPGNILIISEDGDSSDPDDNGRGGQITFNFDQVVTFLGFDVLDDVTNFSVTANTGDMISGISLDHDRQFQSFVDLDWVGVTSLTFDFANASGAIDNIAFELAPVPLPASLPLLIAGVAGMGALARRRSKS